MIKGMIGLEVKDKDFALAFKRAIEIWSGVRATFHFNKHKSLYRVGLYSILAVKFFREFNLEQLKDSSTKVKAAFISGFFDAEGGVSGSNLDKPRIATRFIACFNTNKELIDLVSYLLVSIGISIQNVDLRKNTGITGKCDCYRLRIGRRENLEKFYSKVGFKIRRKQEHLKRVLESYS